MKFFELNLKKNYTQLINTRLTKTYLTLQFGQKHHAAAVSLQGHALVLAINSPQLQFYANLKSSVPHVDTCNTQTGQGAPERKL